MFLAGAGLALWLGSRKREPPLDRDEILIIRQFADQVHKENFQPFE
jgi:hypothetical protein